MRAPLRSLQRFFFKREVARTRRVVGDRIHADAGGRVQAGPLAGMAVLREEVWGDTMVAKILGSYEKELRAALEEGADGPVLCLVDVEGDELELLDPDAVPGLRGADLVVECHDGRDDAVRPRLAERFRCTHEVERVEREGRAPSKLEALRRYPDLEAYLAILEPCSRSSVWLVLRARRSQG